MWEEFLAAATQRFLTTKTQRMPKDHKNKFTLSFPRKRESIEIKTAILKFA